MPEKVLVQGSNSGVQAAQTWAKMPKFVTLEMYNALSYITLKFSQNIPQPIYWPCIAHSNKVWDL